MKEQRINRKDKANPPFPISVQRSHRYHVISLNAHAMEDLESATVEEICEYLIKSIPGIDEDIIENFKRHKIDSSVFIQLTDEYLRELAPLLGDRLKIKRAVSQCLIIQDPVYSSPQPTECEVM